MVTIEAVRVLDNGESDSREPPEIQLAATLYEDPDHFNRSVHVANRYGPMALRTGERAPHNRLPPPLTLCTSPGRSVSFVLHASENDDTGGRFATDFDNEDDVLPGIRRDFASQLPAGSQTARSSDLEVTFRVQRAADTFLPVCQPLTKPVPG